jgi:hypothetical protein
MNYGPLEFASYLQRAESGHGSAAVIAARAAALAESRHMNALTVVVGDTSRIRMARAALLLASEPVDKVNGRVTYSQQILKEFGWIGKGTGRGVDTPGTGYSQI